MMSFAFLLLTTSALLESTTQWRINNNNSSFWLNRSWIPGNQNYEQVYLIEPRFKSKKLAGLEWSSGSSTDSGATQSRHLDWAFSSDDDGQMATATEKGFLSELFDDGDDSKDSEDLDLRQHHRKKYVKVDKMVLPLLIAYKLKFFTMVPLLIGALVLLVTTTGLAGFFFALFAAAAGLHAKKH